MPTSTPKFVARPPRRAALRIALIYALFGALWIAFSDQILYTFVSHETDRRYHLQTLKGWLFIAVTATLVYFLIRRTVHAFHLTQRRHAEALQQLNQTLATIIDNSPLAIVTLDLAGNIQSWNPAATRLFGFSRDEVLGKPLPMIPPERRAIMEDNNRRLLAGERIESMEVRGLHKDGSQIDVSLWAAPFTSEGRIIGNVRLYADITDRKRAEQEIQHLTETLEKRVTQRTALLEEANEELGAFSYTVSHDLRIPLRSLQAIARHLLDSNQERLDDTGRSDALRIVGAAARMERQIEDLLEYARLSHEQLKLEPVSLVLLIHELIGRLDRDPAIAARDPQFVVSEPLGWVLAHPLTLQYVILNLMLNAITHVPDGGRPAIHISCHECGSDIRLYVQDNGPGVPVEKRAALLQSLACPPSSTSTAVSERGDDPASASNTLGGLSLVRRGLARMRGSAGFDATPTGSRFWIQLPRVD